MRTEAAPPAAADGPWWRSTWVLGRREWARLAVALAAVVGTYTILGILLTSTFAPNPVTELDTAVAEGFVDVRTDTRDDLAHWGALLSATPTKIVVTAVVAVGAIVVWRRWLEATLVGLSLLLEATAFIVITQLVGRPRPDVPRLLDSPVASSFPSGHVASATVYLAVVVVVFWHTRAVWARTTALVAVSALPVVVGTARMYQGMHFPSDVVAGFALGLVALAICTWVLPTPEEHAGATGRTGVATPEPGAVGPEPASHGSATVVGSP